MRVLVVSDVSSWMRGGVPAETRQLIEGLLARGHVVALASDAPVDAAQSAAHFAITIPVGPTFPGELKAALAEFRPDFVHVMCMNSKGVLMLARLLRAHAWALTVHSVSPYEKKLHGWHGNDRSHYALRDLRYLPHSLAWRFILRSGMVPRVIVHSRFVSDIVLRYGCARDRLTLIPLYFGLDAAGDRRGAHANGVAVPLLLTVGGLTHSKGQRDVVLALPRLLERFPGLRYQMVGEIRDPSYVDSLHRLARKLQLEDRLVVTPDLGRGEVVAAMSLADVYVQPSHEEGFCLAYAEAAALVPRLVGTETGAMAEMSSGDAAAKVVAAGDPGAIAAAVTELLAAELPRDHMAERMRRLSSRFCLAAYLQAHEKIYSGAS